MYSLQRSTSPVPDTFRHASGITNAISNGPQGMPSPDHYYSTTRSDYALREQYDHAYHSRTSQRYDGQQLSYVHTSVPNSNVAYGFSNPSLSYAGAGHGRRYSPSYGVQDYGHTPFNLRPDHSLSRSQVAPGFPLGTSPFAQTVDQAAGPFDSATRTSYTPSHLVGRIDGDRQATIPSNWPSRPIPNINASDTLNSSDNHIIYETGSKIVRTIVLTSSRNANTAQQNPHPDRNSSPTVQADLQNNSLPPHIRSFNIAPTIPSLSELIALRPRIPGLLIYGTDDSDSTTPETSMDTIPGFHHTQETEDGCAPRTNTAAETPRRTSQNHDVRLRDPESYSEEDYDKSLYEDSGSAEIEVDIPEDARSPVTEPDSDDEAHAEPDYCKIFHAVLRNKYSSKTLSPLNPLQNMPSGSLVKFKSSRLISRLYPSNSNSDMYGRRLFDLERQRR
ncbi:hypothetical protein EW146_g1877 [Bondarzewia mesenterica]|uniref:Uncharacterized protein n=1 Tax=Bondarzewia mesenterica TaxID=1095465 RepID=A0A4S4M2B3_9AGAM|nr:hypothetical protein EW146_g1877 [Bondarzewia mesenterica]